MIRTALLGLCLCICLVAAPVSAKVVQYSAEFVGSEMVPPTGSTATAVGVFIIDTDANTLHSTITMTGIVGDAVPIVHGPAPPGQSTPGIFPLPVGNPVSIGVWDYEEDFEDDLLAGLMYIDIHTDAFPDGEIRSQILEDSGAGRVNRTSGSAQDVLRIDGDAGQPGCRRVEVSVGAPLTVSCDASNAGPAIARYVIWAWIGEPAAPTELSADGSSLGFLANPIPLTGGSPQPFRCLRGGLPGPLCAGVIESPAPPTVPFSVLRSSGIASALTITLHGIIEDDGSEHSTGFSPTNVVVLVVN